MNHFLTFYLDTLCRMMVQQLLLALCWHAIYSDKVDPTRAYGDEVCYSRHIAFEWAGLCLYNCLIP